MTLQALTFVLFLIAAPTDHEVLAELGELLQHPRQRSACWPNTNFVTNALDFNLNVVAFVREVGRYADGLGITVPENSGSLHFILYVCTVDLLLIDSAPLYIRMCTVDYADFSQFHDAVFKVFGAGAAARRIASSLWYGHQMTQRPGEMPTELPHGRSTR